MSPETRSNFHNIQPLGNPRNRYICLKRCERRSKLCYARLVRLERLLSRRTQQILALRPSLGLSTTVADATSIAPLKHCQRSFHNNSTQVDETLLAPRFETPSAHTADQDSQFEDQPGRHIHRASTSSCLQSTPGSLAHFGWNTLTNHWSDQEKELLQSCWRESTRRVYTPIWNKWLLWCQQFDIDCRSPKPNDVAKCLAHLYISEKLAYRSILVYKSTIASICETLGSIKISSSPIVKHILKAISFAKPAPPKAPIWDARILIRYLKNTNPNIENLYDVSRRTATILLLCSSRRVHDLSLLRCDPNHFIDNGDSITLYPEFGSKTDSLSYQQSSWLLHTCPDRNIDPVFWLRTLIKISKDLRGSNSNLFIVTRRKIRAATPTTIGGWVRRVLTEAGIEASPGSFRSAVSSLNWIENYPINDILAKANWQHESTFRKFYQRELNQSKKPLKEKSLSKYFSVTN